MKDFDLPLDTRIKILVFFQTWNNGRSGVCIIYIRPVGYLLAWVANV